MRVLYRDNAALIDGRGTYSSNEYRAKCIHLKDERIFLFGVASSSITTSIRRPSLQNHFSDLIPA